MSRASRASSPTRPSASRSSTAGRTRSSSISPSEPPTASGRPRARPGRGDPAGGGPGAQRQHRLRRPGRSAPSPPSPAWWPRRRREGALAIAAVGTAGLRIAERTRPRSRRRGLERAGTMLTSRSSRARRRAAWPTSAPRPSSCPSRVGSSSSTPAAAAASSRSGTATRSTSGSVSKWGRFATPRPSAWPARYRWRLWPKEPARRSRRTSTGSTGRPQPDALIGMGGALTNMTAVALGIDRVRPGDRVHGARPGHGRDRSTDRAVPDPPDADGRRPPTRLQPGRAEVILAGACIVRTVMDRLGFDVRTVSDRGLRHGVLLERFG